MVSNLKWDLGWDPNFTEITSYESVDGSVESRMSNLLGYHISFVCMGF